MYRIPMLDGFVLVDCSWRSYDPDRFEIESIEWEIGIMIPKCVWFNLRMPEWHQPVMYQGWYIHEYIFAWMCENEQIEYYEDW